MLKNLMEKVSGQQLLPAAFERCGLFPINSVEVTERISHAITTQEIAQYVDKVLLKTLEVQRFGDPVKKVLRGNKIPGQSHSS